MSRYDLSIIIPVYNAEHYIARCAKSLFEQTLERIEFIFVDDSSADGSVQTLRDVLNRYESRMCDVRIIKHPENKGVSAARNTGLLHATGEYIGWVDSDDWVADEMFSKLYGAAVCEDADVVWCDFNNVFADGIQVELQNIEDKMQVIRGLLLGTRHGNLWSSIAKRELYSSHVIRFPESLCLMEDKYVLMQLVFYAKKLKYVPGAYYYYEKNNIASITTGWSNRNLPWSAIQSLNAIIAFVESTELGSMLQKEMRYARLILKKGLLNTASMEAFIIWKNLFAEENRYVLGCPNMTGRQRVLGWCIDHNWWLVAKLWVYYIMIFCKMNK